MALYQFRCNTLDCFEDLVDVRRPMAESSDPAHCPECEQQMQRIYNPSPQIWHCDGAHRTDYDRHGDKRERLNKGWSEYFGEPPPPPDPSVPRNSSEKF